MNAISPSWISWSWYSYGVNEKATSNKGCLASRPSRINYHPLGAVRVPRAAVFRKFKYPVMDNCGWIVHFFLFSPMEREEFK